MTKDEKTCNHDGIGGYKCPCCGPAPKHRKKARRTVRRRIKTLVMKEIRAERIEYSI